MSEDTMHPDTRKRLVRAWRRFSDAYNAETEADRHAQNDPSYKSRLDAAFARAHSARAQAVYVLAIGANLRVDATEATADELWQWHPVNLRESLRAHQIGDPIEGPAR